mgnify:FL=1|tara:strand:- start:254 stop:598 length:345 start_codon:yes stop_codon:yes gene_type:complete
MKKHPKKKKSYSIIRKLRKEGKLPEEMEIFVSNLSLEDLIALKLEIASKPISGKLYGIPIWKSIPFIVRDAVLKTAISVCRTKVDAANLLGMDVDKMNNLLKKYNTIDFFEETD